MPSAPFQVGTGDANNDPAYQFGNATGGGILDTWTSLISNTARSVANVVSSLLGIGTSVGEDPPGTLLVALNGTGDLGIAGHLNMQADATDPASITAADGQPTTSSLNPGSLDMRTDSSALGPRLFVYSSAGFQTSSEGWLEVTAGLGIYNVKDYGAAGDATHADGPAIQAALSQALLNGGGCIYLPAGTYRVSASMADASTCLKLADVGSGIAIIGAGDSTVIITSDDVDILTIDGGSNGLLIRDIDFKKDGDAGTHGAAIHLTNGNGSQYLIENVQVSDTAIGLFCQNASGEGRVIASKFVAAIAGGYTSAGIQASGTHFKGGIYGLIIDNSNSVLLTNVSLFGPLSLTSWSTQAQGSGDLPHWPGGGGGQNSIYCFNLEQNYNDPADGDFVPNEGVGGLFLGACQGEVHLDDCLSTDTTLIGGTLSSDSFSLGFYSNIMQDTETVFVPRVTTIQGGRFSVAAHDFTGIGKSALIIAAGSDEQTSVTISDGAYDMGQDVEDGYCIDIDSSVECITIMGNNIFANGNATYSINLQATVSVSVQGNNICGNHQPPIFIPTSPAGPFIVARNPGFNPTGLSHSFALLAGTTTLQNTYGVPGTFYVAGTTVTGVSVGNPGSTHATNLKTGAFHVEPGEEIVVTVSGLASSAIFVGD